jgi:hypothetical protein
MGRVFYNNTPDVQGAGKVLVQAVAGGASIGNKTYSKVRNVDAGYISLYEMNIDRPGPLIVYDNGNTIRYITGSIIDKMMIYPFITKDGARASFKSVSTTNFANEFAYGDVLSGSYPLSASITREYINGNASSSFNKHYYSLRNRLDFYGIRSDAYKISAPSMAWPPNRDLAPSTPPTFDVTPGGGGIGTDAAPASAFPGNSIDTGFGPTKDLQILNMITIPSIFFGSKIKPGTVSLKYYFTGSLAGELRDTRQNGELIQVSGTMKTFPENEDLCSVSGSTNIGKTAGVVLYDEGYIILTGAWGLDTGSSKVPISFDGTSLSTDYLKWINFGAGCNDGVKYTGDSPLDNENLKNVSYNLSFEGTTETQVMTMFAKAKRGQANYSNNPTYLKFGQETLRLTSSHVYEENPERIVANVVSSSYTDYSASFERSVYISKVGIYDANKNLIGVATLANPVLKKEDEDLAIKIRFDL